MGSERNDVWKWVAGTVAALATAAICGLAGAYAESRRDLSELRTETTAAIAEHSKRPHDGAVTVAQYAELREELRYIRQRVDAIHSRVNGGGS